MSVSNLKKIKFGRFYTRKYFINKFFRIIFENKKLIDGLIERKVLPAKDAGMLYSIYTLTDQGNSFQITSDMFDEQRARALLEVEPLILCKPNIEAKMMLLLGDELKKYDHN